MVFNVARISVQAGKAKGRRAQQAVVAKVLDTFSALTEDDVRSCPMGSNGSDVILSTAAKAAFPYEVEVKARAAGFSLIYDAMDQAASQGNLTPLVVIKQDRRKPLVVLDMDAFFALIKPAPSAAGVPALPSPPS
jgi:hypothetical protein